MSFADFTSSIATGLVQGIINSNQKPPPKKRYSASKRKRSTRKRVSSIPSSCSAEAWSTQSVNNKTIATNFKGVIVTYDDMGELIVKLDIKNPIPSMFHAGDKVQTNISFNKGSRAVNAVLSEDNKFLVIHGLDAIYVLSKLKSASYVKVDFVNNNYCSRLKGSGTSISTVESAANFWKKNKPDNINVARKERAHVEHKEHAKRVSSNQKEFSQKVSGIRAKSDLDAADGNIYGTKIQYYIPGSEEIGEMWVNWFIDDDKGPMMRLHFMDPTHQYENQAYKIDISLEPIQFPCNTDIAKDSNKNTSPSCQIVKDLLRADKWGKIAKKQNLKRRYRKRVSYVNGDENSKISTAIYFQVYEDGSMTAQIEEVKHGFPKRFNFTLNNALELARYIETTREKAKQKWMNKTRTKEDLDALFK